MTSPADLRPQIRVSWDAAYRPAARALASAFAADAAWSTELRTERARRVVLQRLMSALTEEAARHGGLLVARAEAKVVGAACVWAPGFHPTPRPSALYLLAGAAIVRHAGLRTLRLLQRWRLLQRADPERHHWHLALIGVAPRWQRAGVGSLLMEAYLQRVRDAGGTAYLETSRPELVEWYGRSGFEVREQLLLPGLRTAWTMWRAPSDHEPADVRAISAPV